MRNLHDRLSEHLERVQAGEEIVVTRRGRPIPGYQRSMPTILWTSSFARGS